MALTLQEQNAQLELLIGASNRSTSCAFAGRKVVLNTSDFYNWRRVCTGDRGVPNQNVIDFVCREEHFDLPPAEYNRLQDCFYELYPLHNPALPGYNAAANPQCLKPAHTVLLAAFRANNVAVPDQVANGAYDRVVNEMDWFETYIRGGTNAGVAGHRHIRTHEASGFFEINSHVRNAARNARAGGRGRGRGRGGRGGRGHVRRPRNIANGGLRTRHHIR